MMESQNSAKDRTAGADTGGGRGKIRPPPEFGIFCSYFQNSFSIACLIGKETLVQNRKNICLNEL